MPTQYITEKTKNLFNQEDPSTLSTINTIDTQTLQTHHRQNYDPPPHRSETSPHSTPTYSPQQGSSNTFQNREHTLTQSQSQPNTSPRQSTQTIQYVPAQPSIAQNPNSVLTINTLHTNSITNTTTSRTLSRPPLSLFKNNPLSYNLTSTYFHSHSSSNTTQYNTNFQSSSTQFNNHIPPNTIQTNPHNNLTFFQPQANTLNIPQTFNSHNTYAIPSSTTPLPTLNTPTSRTTSSTSRNNYQRNTNPHYRQRSTSRTRYNYDRNTTPPHCTRSRYDNYQRDSRSHRSPYMSSYRSPYTRDSRPRYKSRSYSRDNNFQNTLLHLDLLQDLETSDTLDLVYTLIHEI